MHLLHKLAHAVPLLACVLLSAEAQSDSSSIFDSLRTSWSSALDSSKSAFDELHSSLSSALDSSKTALDNLRISVSDAIKPSKNADEDHVRPALLSGKNTSAPSTTGATGKHAASPARKSTGIPAGTRTGTQAAVDSANPTSNIPDSPIHESIHSPTALKAPTLSEILAVKPAVYPTVATNNEPSASPTASPTKKHATLTDDQVTSTTQKLADSSAAAPTDITTGELPLPMLFLFPLLAFVVIACAALCVRNWRSRFYTRIAHDILERLCYAEKNRADHAVVEAREAIFRAEEAEARCQLLESDCRRLEDRLEPSLRLRSGQKCSFEDVIRPCLTQRPTISAPVRSVSLEDSYLISDYQLRNLEAVLEFLVQSVPSLLYVLVRTKSPEACRQQLNEAQRTNTETHMNTLTEMFERVKGPSQVVFRLKYNDAMHDRKMLFDSGWELHMGKGLDFIRPQRGPVNASTKYRSRDVGEASIDFTYTWAEAAVAEYFLEQLAVEEFDVVV